jgi:hypothetical protein
MAITYIDENQVNDFDKKFEEKVGVNMEDYVLSFLKHQFRNQIVDVKQDMKKRNKTLDELISECKDKTSQYSKKIRTMLVEIKKETLEKFFVEDVK